jgi:hypothetical protein
MTRTRNAALVALILVPALAVAACGGSEDNDFREGYNTAVKPLSELNSGIGSSINGAEGQSNAAIEKEFQKLADKAQQTRANLSELDPPDDAKQEFDALLAALDDGTADLNAVAKAAGSNDPAKAAEAAQDLVKSGTKIQEAETKLQQAVDG